MVCVPVVAKLTFAQSRRWIGRGRGVLVDQATKLRASIATLCCAREVFVLYRNYT